MKKPTNPSGMSARDLITKARAGLILDQPFYASIALKLPTVERRDIETAQTDGTCIAYNPAFIESRPAHQVKSILAHEVMHVALMSHLRRGDRDPETWNEATDYVINSVLKAQGFDIPKDWLTNDDLGKLAAEEIYRRLQQKPKGQQPQPGKGKQQTPGNGPQPPQEASKGQGQGDGTPQPGGKPQPDPGQAGAVADSPSPDQNQAESEARQMVEQALEAERQAGRNSADFERIFGDILNPRENWRELLRRFMSLSSRQDYSWSKPNRKFIAAGLYLPALNVPALGRVVLAVDTSGSIREAEISQVAAEVRDIMAQWPGTQAEVIYCDSEIKGRQELADDMDPLKPQGGGGTSYKPVFDALDQEEAPEVLIYFTDGYCNSFPDQAPAYPVIWLILGDMHEQARQYFTFGEIVESRKEDY